LNKAAGSPLIPLIPFLPQTRNLAGDHVAALGLELAMLPQTVAARGEQVERDQEDNDPPRDGLDTPADKTGSASRAPLRGGLVVELKNVTRLSASCPNCCDGRFASVDEDGVVQWSEGVESRLLCR
jgi:ribosomal protein S27AE